MKRFSLLRGWRSGRTQSALDWVPQAIAFYAIPVAIALFSLAALFFWDDLYSAHAEKSLELHVLAQSGSAFSLSDAQQKLPQVPLTRFYNTELSERPVWFSFSTQGTTGSANMVEFPSRHAVNMACWDGASLKPLGDSTSANHDSGITPVKAGYALKLERPGVEVICRTSFIGPARLSANLWAADQLDVSNRDFHRKSGLIDGGLIVLALFVLITALINRQSLYVLFAAWLIVTVRLGATSGGWDDQWLNHAVPADWLSQGRSFTRAAWALLTVTLFKSLFRADLAKMRYAIAITVLQWMCLALFVAAAVLPRSMFVPTMWLLAAIWVPVFIFGLFSIVYRTRSRVALLYGAALAVTLLSSLFDLVAAAYGTKGIDSSVNSVVASLASGLLISLAIAEQMRQEHKERLKVQAELEHTYEAMPIGLFTLSLQGRFMSANPALHKMLGRHMLRVGQSAWHQYFSEGAWPQLYQMVNAQQDGEIELQGASSDSHGRSKRFLVKATLARDKIEGSLQDVTEKSKATEDLKFLANNDPLTKVLNRRGIEKVLESAMAQLAAGKPLALAYLDLDRFKLINDLYGHNAGDDVLLQVCDRVSNVLSGSMKIGRVGGDEFVIVLPDTRMPLAELICRGIVDSIGQTPYRVDDKAFHVRGSIGLIEVSPGTKIKDAVSTADRACREAKTGQSDGLIVYEKNAAAFQAHEAELKLVERFSSASATEGLFLEMQPIMSLTAPHDSLNFEVLLRMRDLDGRLIPTDRLIAAGESSGYMSVIDRWVLSTTLAWLNTNYEHLAHTKFICMNLNGASLNDEKFLEDVVAMLTENIHLAGHLCYEITESVALHDLTNTRRFIDTVRGCGARVALDDFGAGYTSFSYLKDLPADLLKIDGSFIVDMNSHPANIAIVEAIVSLANNMGMKTIAEWAEDNATVQTLAEIGVDYVQGYAVARPQSPDKLLTAASSASFIQDEQLAQFARLLGQSDQPLVPLDLFAQEPIKKVH